jgi:hypothetical protein
MYKLPKLPVSNDRLDEAIYDSLRQAKTWGIELRGLVYFLRQRYDFDLHEQKPRIQKRVQAMAKMGFLAKEGIGGGSRWIAIP